MRFDGNRSIKRSLRGEIKACGARRTPVSMIMAVRKFAVGVELVERGRTAAPSLGLMHFGLMLAGLGTALLGPILPLLARQWGMVDSQSGLLMMAKFCGAFLGGVTVSGKLRWGLGCWRFRRQ